MRFRTVLLALLGVSLTYAPVDAQADPLVAEVEERLNDWMVAWSARDVEAIVSQGETLAGFGFRTRAARGVPNSLVAWTPEVLTPFFNSLEYYNLELVSVHAEAHGSVVIAWGFFTEDFKHRGAAPERYLVRFTDTMLRNQDGSLTSVMKHRDVQPFGEDGRYIRRPIG